MEVTIELEGLSDRESEVLLLRSCGKTQSEIASELGISQQAVSQILKRILAQAKKPDSECIEALRLYDVRQCEYMLLKLQDGIKKGIPRTIEVGLKVMERKAKLMGYDSPDRLQIEDMTEKPYSSGIDEFNRRLFSLARKGGTGMGDAVA